MPIRFFLLTLVLPLIIGITPAFAQTTPPEMLGHFGEWQAYHFEENGQPVCYMVTSKAFSSSKKFRRGTAYLMVTHRPQENATDVVNYSPGYIFSPTHDVRVMLGTTAFSLFADKDSAWTRSPHTDHALVAAMNIAKSLTIIGVPAVKGIPAQSDVLNISGVSAAYQAINKACGLHVSTPPKTTAKTKKTTP